MVVDVLHDLGTGVLLRDLKPTAEDAAQGIRAVFRRQAPRPVPQDGV